MAWQAVISQVDRSSEKIHITLEYSDGLHDVIRELIDLPDEADDTWLTDYIATKLKKLTQTDLMEDTLLKNITDTQAFELDVENNLTVVDKPLDIQAEAERI